MPHCTESAIRDDSGLCLLRKQPCWRCFAKTWLASAATGRHWAGSRSNVGATSKLGQLWLLPSSPVETCRACGERVLQQLLDAFLLFASPGPPASELRAKCRLTELLMIFWERFSSASWSLSPRTSSMSRGIAFPMCVCVCAGTMRT